MKIAMFVKDLQVSGGFQKLVLRLAQELKNKKNQVIIYSPIINKEKCYPEIIKNENIKYIKNEKIEKNNNTKLNRIKIIFYYILLIFKFKKADVIIFHDETSLIILNFISVKKTKTLWMLNNQFPEYLYQTKNQSSILKKIFYKLIKNGIEKLDMLLTYDKFNYDLVKKYTKKNVEVIYAGADIDNKNILNKKEVRDTIKLISVGVVFEYRRYEDIIEAVNILKKEGLNCELEIIGDIKFADNYIKKLKYLSQKYNLEKNIKFCGAISDSELDAKYRQADVFLFVNDALTWGISVFEAMSYKLPTIITNNIGAIDLIKDENCSFMVSPKSPQEIANAIKEIKYNKAKIKNMIKNYKNPLNMVSWQAYARRIIKSIEKI